MIHALAGVLPKGPEARKNVAPAVRLRFLKAMSNSPVRGVRIAVRESYAPHGAVALLDVEPQPAGWGYILSGLRPFGQHGRKAVVYVSDKLSRRAAED